MTLRPRTIGELGNRAVIEHDLNVYIPFALCLTPAEYRRAVHSMRLDTSLLSVLTAITGDATFLGWAGGLPVRADINADVPRMVYEHALLCEYAHARLSWMSGR